MDIHNVSVDEERAMKHQQLNPIEEKSNKNFNIYDSNIILSENSKEIKNQVVHHLMISASMEKMNETGCCEEKGEQQLVINDYIQDDRTLKNEDRILKLTVSKKEKIHDNNDDLITSSNNTRKKKKCGPATTKAVIRRPSRSKAAIAARKQRKEMEEKARQQFLKELTCPSNLTKKEKSLLHRAFSLGITKIINNDDKLRYKNTTLSSSSKRSKTTVSSKKQKRKNNTQSAVNHYYTHHINHDTITSSADDVQWYFSAPAKYVIEEHPFSYHLLS